MKTERTYADIVRTQFAKHRTAVWGLRIVLFLFVLAVFAPVLAQSSPFYMSVDGESSYPWFGDLLDQNVFPTGVDLFFNLILVLSPVIALCWGLGRLWPGHRRLPLKILTGVFVYIYLSIVLPDGLVESGPGKVIFFPQHVFRYADPKIDFNDVRKVKLETILARQKIDLFEGRVAETKQELDRIHAALAGDALDKSERLNMETEKTAIEAEFEQATTRLETWRGRLAKAGADAEKEDAPEVTMVLPPIGYHHDDNDEERIVERPIYDYSGWGTCHYLGTDQNGRDVLARILYGTRVSLTVGVIAVAIYCTIGTLLGALMGFFGGWVDMLLMRFVEIMICFPTLAFILIIVAVFQSKSIFLIVVAIAVTRWTGAARLIRGQFLQERSLDYVTAARSLGVPTPRIVFKHVLPNAIHPIFVTATFGVAAAILTEASLAFLGLGDPNVPSWGQLMLEGRVTGKLWLILSPGFAIFLTVTVLNLVGEGLRDALDPKLRQ